MDTIFTCTEIRLVISSNFCYFCLKFSETSSGSTGTAPGIPFFAYLCYTIVYLQFTLK